MGLERNAAALFLKMRSDGVRFGRVLTLGHQHAHLDADLYAHVLRRLGRPAAPAVPTFADDLLRTFGATEIDAMDVSAYQGATMLHDLNQPVPAAWHEQFDVVFDGGTLEHVFNISTAIASCMRMLKPQGRFVSVTIPNNWCGHGFYQFSPELFFRALGPDNGFSMVEMYIASVDGRRCYRVTDPAAAKSRVELCNSEPVYLLVHARRDTVREIFANTPQQSDYVDDWSRGDDEPSRPTDPPRAWKGLPLVKQARLIRRRVLDRQRRLLRSLSNRKL